MVKIQPQRISVILIVLEALVFVVPIGRLGLFGLQLTDSAYSTVLVILLLTGVAAILWLMGSFVIQGRPGILRAHALVWLAAWGGGGLVIALAIYGVSLGLVLLVPLAHLSIEFLRARRATRDGPD